MEQEEVLLKERYADKTEVVKFAGKVPVNILLFRRHKHDFENGWETEYLSKLCDTLKDGMVVFDIGAEEGEFTAMAAKIVGGKNVHIFEPSESYWPNIKRLWEINDFDGVGGCFNGFVSDSTNEATMYNYDFKNWPDCSYGDIFYGTNQVIPGSGYYDKISIDDYCQLNNLLPDVIMMDIEGAELMALRGCKQLLKYRSPIFFISVHNDSLMQERSNGVREDLHNLFKDLGYSSLHINTDHEEHWMFSK